MPLLVTSASGVNGDGYGALLAFDRNGAPLGVFCNDKRIADPRGLVVHQHEGLLYLNSGQDRVLALDAAGTVVRDTGPIKSLNPGGGNFGPDGRYYVGLRSARTVTAFPRTLDAPSEHFLAPGIVPFPRGFAFGRNGRLFHKSTDFNEGTKRINGWQPKLRSQFADQSSLGYVFGTAIDEECVSAILRRGGEEGAIVCIAPTFNKWPAPGSADTELGVFMGPEVGHGETKVYAGVQA